MPLSDITQDLSKNEMNVDPCFVPISPVMMNVPDPDILPKNPEKSLQLPTIADNAPHGDRFHVQVGAEVTCHFLVRVYSNRSAPSTFLVR